MVKGVRLADETIRSFNLFGNGYKLTWTSDDRQFMSVHEGVSLDRTQSYTSRIFALEGDPDRFELKELPTYPHMQLRIKRTTAEGGYWGGDCLAIEGTIYQYLNTVSHPYVKDDGSFWPGFRTVGTKIIYSPNNGDTWHNQDGSSPVTWEDWDARSPKNMLFFEEDLYSGTVIQMGKAYRGNKDGYVYMYVEGKQAPLSELALIRVPKDKLLDRSAYECIADASADQHVTWSSNLDQRVAVHRFPDGWIATKVSDGMLAEGWRHTAFYNEVLDLYVLIGQGVGTGSDGGWFGRPSYLGFWVAPTPWGPFHQIHHEKEWTPEGDPAARAFNPVIVPKWISDDGKSFWFAWGDRQYRMVPEEAPAAGLAQNPDGAIVELMKRVRSDAEFTQVFIDFTSVHQAKAMSGYFQRVDLVTD